MIHRYTFEAVERTLRDIMDVDAPFGGKVVITGGDFRQLLPGVPRATVREAIDACILKSSLWEKVRTLRLKENMRARSDPSFSSFLLRVGNGAEPVLSGDMINIPSDMIIPWENESSLDTLIEEIFPNLSYNARNRDYIAERALLTPLNDCVDELNDRVLRSFPGDEVTYYSFDSVQDDLRNLYQPEFLNTLSAGGLPPHKLVLKLDAPIMLLRNINPAKGLCNGTRLLCRGFDRNMIYAEIVTGHAAGNIEFIPESR
ncbi:DNA helicase [Ranunculus cassubicifolius]